MEHTKQLFNFQIHNILSASYLQANSCYNINWILTFEMCQPRLAPFWQNLEIESLF